ncbi:LysR substrate-binding domain-containing protein [Novosphingobium sp. KCTC 2891]|uniref:LysR substrate-binding domain-containing protein n=1 Tax=Novosphingobium sp. KCTC 2891 TaxID=2989730 RepID=UPI002222CFC2|nr:LysR substrate-binding domain-containing protein [Novosphingobium sp. KCTC 2891]MCW1383686.1 LysR substrate-binding domain-containing protein [Novosphingobium sp. KCTC 2891]
MLEIDRKHETRLPTNGKQPRQATQTISASVFDIDTDKIKITWRRNLRIYLKIPAITIFSTLHRISWQRRIWSCYILMISRKNTPMRCTIADKAAATRNPRCTKCICGTACRRVGENPAMTGSLPGFPAHPTSSRSIGAMEDLNDIYYFTSVVQNGGFTAAARTTGVEKTRLSRHVAALEHRVGVRLLHRTTRNIALTEAGERFYAHCQQVLEDARSAFDSVSALRKEPSGKVRMCCPVVLGQSYLAPILPSFLSAHPKVTVYLETTDRVPNLLEERFDLALRTTPAIADSTELVARDLGHVRRILVASPDFLRVAGDIGDDPASLAGKRAICSIADTADGTPRWMLFAADRDPQRLVPTPCLVTSDLRVQLEAATQGVGIALLPEPVARSALRSGNLVHVLPAWSAPDHLVHLVYPSPRGILPSVRSLIDFLVTNLPSSIAERPA